MSIDIYTAARLQAAGTRVGAKLTSRGIDSRSAKQFEKELTKAVTKAIEKGKFSESSAQVLATVLEYGLVNA